MVEMIIWVCLLSCLILFNPVTVQSDTTVFNSKKSIRFEIKSKHETIDLSDSAVTLNCVSDSYSTHD